MKVAIVASFYIPSIGGVEYIVYYTARELVRRNHEVHIITTTYDNNWKKIAEPGMTIEEGIFVHRLQPSIIRVGYATIMKDLKKTLKEIKPDVIHCHDLHPYLFQIMRWKRKLGYKVVAQFHHPIATGIDHSVARLLYKFVMKKLVRDQSKIDAFVAHTNMERLWLINEGINKNKIHKITYPCIPDELFFYKPRKNIREILGVDKVITSISRICFRKGQHLLVESAKYLKQQFKGNFKIYIAGPPSDMNYLKALLEKVKNHDLGNYVNIFPRVLPENEKRDMIATSDVFVSASLKDYTPVVILEALALKTPVVSTKVGAIPEIINNIGLGSVSLAEPNAKDIAKKILNILENKYKVSFETLNILKSIHSASILTNKLIQRVYNNI